MSDQTSESQLSGLGDIPLIENGKLMENMQSFEIVRTKAFNFCCFSLFVEETLS
jgi:hypothetical protein